MRLDPKIPLPPPVRPRPARTRLVGMSNGKTEIPVSQNGTVGGASAHDIAMQPTKSLAAPSLPVTPPHGLNGKRSGELSNSDISKQSTTHLMQLSGMMRAVRVPQQVAPEQLQDNEEGYWPQGIQQTGPLPVGNLYGSEPFGRTLPLTAVATPIQQRPAWKAFLSTPVAKVTIGLVVGIGLLFLVARFVDLPATIQVLRERLTTPSGIALALLSGVAHAGLVHSRRALEALLE